MRILVLGLGNTLMSDDGIGPRIIAALRDRCAPGRNLTLLDGGIDGLALLPRLQGVDRLVIIDALDLQGEAGTIQRLAGEELANLPGGMTVHHLGLRDLLSAAELCGCLPGEVVVWGVRPAGLEAGDQLSQEAAAAIEPVLAGVLGDLRRWGALPAQPNPPPMGG